VAVLREGVAKRYARAAFDIAVERDRLEEWSRELRYALEVLTEPKLAALLRSRMVSEGAKLEAIQAALPDLDPLVRNLLILMLDKGRLGLLKSIVEEYEKLLKRHQGIAVMEATTAVPLSPEEGETLMQRFSHILGKRVEITWRVEPQLIGGVVIKIGDRLIDGSVATRLKALRRELATAS